MRAIRYRTKRHLKYTDALLNLTFRYINTCLLDGAFELLASLGLAPLQILDGTADGILDSRLDRLDQILDRRLCRVD